MLPFTSFWTSTKPFGTPLGPYLVKWSFTLLMILAPPAGDAFNFSTLDLCDPFVMVGQHFASFLCPDNASGMTLIYLSSCGSRCLPSIILWFITHNRIGGHSYSSQTSSATSPRLPGLVYHNSIRYSLTPLHGNNAVVST